MKKIQSKKKVPMDVREHTDHQYFSYKNPQARSEGYEFLIMRLKIKNCTSVSAKCGHRGVVQAAAKPVSVDNYRA